MVALTTWCPCFIMQSIPLSESKCLVMNKQSTYQKNKYFEQSNFRRKLGGQNKISFHAVSESHMYIPKERERAENFIDESGSVTFNKY